MLRLVIAGEVVELTVLRTRLSAFVSRLLSRRSFLLCSFVYLLNTVLIRSNCGLDCAFTRSYLNDLLLVPVTIPVLFEFFTLVNLREEEGMPKLFEFLPILIIWSLLFEVIGPNFLGMGFGDVVDIGSYFLGAFVSIAVWKIE
jgi:hypothetical protein